LDHGVDFELFASAENDHHVPPDVSDVPGPIVGFFGGFGQHTTDVSLLERVVGLMPDASFVFVGRSSAECKALAAMPNVHMLGQRPYEMIPHYGKRFDVAIMPWQQNEWIKACNPIKLKEYLALGKPVVSRPYDELRKYADVVYEAVSPEEFVAAIRRALREDGPDRIAARRDMVRDASWNRKAQTILRQLCPSWDFDFDYARDVAKV
jgi:glycosyltransferase involved in cell wall biosynthesis